MTSTDTPKGPLSSHLPTDWEAVVLFDGPCGFCNAFARLVQRARPDGRVLTVPFQSSLGQALIATRRNQITGDAIALVERKSGDKEMRMTVRSDAVLNLAHHFGGWWHVVRAGWAVPRAVRDRIYDAVARNRYVISRRWGRGPSRDHGMTCPLP